MRTLNLYLLLSVLQLQLLLPQAPPDLSGPPASVDGIVTDSETQQPLAGATLTVQDRSSSGGKLITVTGNDGRFTLRNLPPGQYMIEASRSGYVSEMAGSPLVDTRNLSPDPLALRNTPIVQNLAPGQVLSGLRSEERRVGKECRSRWSP